MPVLTFAALSACASTAKIPAPDADGLPQQTLAPGECGLFGWTTERPIRFVFFATSDRGSVMLADKSVVALTPGADIPDGDYSPVTLTLGLDEAIVGGTRYPSARMKQTLADGFTQVTPLVVVQACQTAPATPDAG